MARTEHKVVTLNLSALDPAGFLGHVVGLAVSAVEVVVA